MERINTVVSFKNKVLPESEASKIQKSRHSAIGDLFLFRRISKKDSLRNIVSFGSYGGNHAKFDAEDIEKVTISRFSLSYIGPPGCIKALEEDFTQQLLNCYYSIVKLSLLSLISICVISMMNVVYGLAGVQEGDEVGKQKKLYELVVWSIFSITMSIGYIVVKDHKNYMQYGSKTIMILALIYGVCLLIIRIVVDTGAGYFAYGTLVYVTFIFNFIPLRFRTSFMLNSLVVSGYCIYPILFTKTDDVMQIINPPFIMLLTGLLSHWKELSLRKSQLSREILQLKGLELEEEEARTTNLLLSALPEEVSSQLRKQEQENKSLMIAEKFEEVTIMFCEICDFNEITAENDEQSIMVILNTIFSKFDTILEDFEVHKVETVGEVYMVAGGCPMRSKNHAENVAMLALDFISVMPELTRKIKSQLPNFSRKVSIRIGINTGSIVAGVVGVKTPRYKLFGDTVNTASRMESTCSHGKIQVSKSTQTLLESRFILSHRGKITVKGKGQMDTYFLLNRKDSLDSDFMKVVDTDSYAVPAEAEGPRLSPQEEIYQSTRSTRRRNLNGWANSGRVTGQQNLDLVEMFKQRKPQSMWDMFKTPPYITKDIRELFVHDNFDTYIIDLRKYCAVAALSIFCYIVVYPAFYNEFLRSEENLNSANTTSQNSAVSSLAFQNYCVMIGMVLALWVLGLPYFRKFLKKKIGHWTVITLITMLMYIVTIYLQLHVEYNNVGGPEATFFFLNNYFFLQLAFIPLVYRVFMAFLTVSIYLTVFLNAALNGALPQTVNEILEDAGFLFFTCGMSTLGIMLNEKNHLEDYNNKYNTQIQQKTLIQVKNQAVLLLKRLLPHSVVPRLINKVSDEFVVDQFSETSVLFTDMVNFTKFSRKVSPMQLMVFLNEMYTKFDSISERYGIYKVEIIGDAYFAVSGCPIPCEDHAQKMILAAVEMLESIKDIRNSAKILLENAKKKAIENNEEIDESYDQEIGIRIGIHVGPIVAGVVGHKDPRYHIFGDSVSFANTMESKGKPGRIHISESTHEKIKNDTKFIESNGFTIEKRENVFLSSRTSPQNTYFIDKRSEEG